MVTARDRFFYPFLTQKMESVSFTIKNTAFLCLKQEGPKALDHSPESWSRGYKIFSMLKLAEHEIYPAHNCLFCLFDLILYVPSTIFQL